MDWSVLGLGVVTVALFVATLLSQRGDRASSERMYQQRLQSAAQIRQSVGAGGAETEIVTPPPPSDAPSTATALGAMVTLIAMGALLLFGLPTFHKPTDDDVPVEGCGKAHFKVPSTAAIGRSVIAQLTPDSCRNAVLTLNGSVIANPTVNANAMFWTFSVAAGQQLVTLYVPKPSAVPIDASFVLQPPAKSSGASRPPPFVVKASPKVAGCKLSVVGPPNLPPAGVYAIDVSGLNTCPQLYGASMLYINGTEIKGVGTVSALGNVGDRYLATVPASPADQRVDLIIRSPDASVTSYVITGSDQLTLASLLQSGTAISGSVLQLLGLVGIAFTFFKRKGAAS